ncbi:uncharacterized protein LOC124290439 [Haliotis rubra]|uniref:uncharacterized protein LOC124290439 n=1 Tax=Haliotis rubra TaxID=36100 RepID=UPI001EE5C2A7|nr:uncharacterized protein LOC124290439 [Haliotis rubra]
MSQQQGRQPNLSSTQDDALALPSTDTPVVRKWSQRQGMQFNPSSTQEGVMALQRTDPPAVMEENQRQGIQSSSPITHNHIGCSVSQYDLSNSSHTSLGNPGHRGCVSQASLSIRIKQLNEVFEGIHTLHTAEELLKKHNHVAVCGAPGDGKQALLSRYVRNICKRNMKLCLLKILKSFKQIQ